MKTPIADSACAQHCSNVRRLGTLFLLFGLVCVWFTVFAPALKTWQIQSWTPTPCRIIHQIKPQDPTTFVTFRYHVNGQNWVGEWLHPIFHAQSQHSFRRDYPNGAKAVCFVNPANPAEAVSQRDFSLSLLFFLIWGGEFVMGGIVSWRAPHTVSIRGVNPCEKMN